MIPAMAQAALDKRVTGRTMQVYVYLASQLDVCEYRPLKIRALARMMHLNVSNASQSVNTLVNRGYLDTCPDPSDDRRTIFRLTYSLPKTQTTRAA